MATTLDILNFTAMECFPLFLDLHFVVCLLRKALRNKYMKDKSKSAFDQYCFIVQTIWSLFRIPFDHFL